MKSVKDLLQNVVAANNRLIAAAPDGDREFFDAGAFEWVGAIEAGYAEIRREFLELMEYGAMIPPFHEVSSRQRPITSDARWQTFFFKVYGKAVPEAGTVCPATARLLDRIPGADTAMFSILQPGKTIPEHCGANKSVLRYHLGIVVPSEDPDVCGIRVGQNQKAWREGGSLIFDDTFPHSAWNRSDSLRAVLFVDVRRPQTHFLRATSALVNTLAGKFHPDVRETVRNSRRFAKQIIAMHARPGTPGPQ